MSAMSKAHATSVKNGSAPTDKYSLNTILGWTIAALGFLNCLTQLQYRPTLAPADIEKFIQDYFSPMLAGSREQTNRGFRVVIHQSSLCVLGPVFSKPLFSIGLPCSVRECLHVYFINSCMPGGYPPESFANLAVIVVAERFSICHKLLHN